VIARTDTSIVNVVARSADEAMEQALLVLGLDWPSVREMNALLDEEDEPKTKRRSE
jgi:hypothetical protein